MPPSALKLKTYQCLSVERPTERPADKLQARGTDALSDSELLSIVIGSGTTLFPTTDMSNDILQRFDNKLNALSMARIDELQTIEGVDKSVACKIAAAFELGRRRLLETAKLQKDMNSAMSIYNYMRPMLMDLQIEEFHVVLMNIKCQLIKSVKISQGGMTETPVDVRIIIREALLANAPVICAVHNHPSGNPKPSKQDDNLTTSLKKACDMMRIHLLDHVIVADDSYYSYHEMGRL